MNQRETWIEYDERFDAVLTYIYDHLDEPLDLIRLAEVAGFSPRHWHRIFVSAFGESLSALVKRVRLQRAVSLLVSDTMPVRRIASECGFPDQSSFTRAFKAATGTTPARFRSSGTHVDLRMARARQDPDAFEVRVRELTQVRCIAARHRGSYLTIDRTFHELRVWLAAHGHDLADQDMYGVYLSDPTRTPESDLKSIACATVPPGISGRLEPLSPDAAQVESFTIRGGPYAGLTHIGAYADMPDTYAWLFGHWVPESGRRLADDPVVERYISSPQDSAPTSNAVELLLPLVA
ncbi:AraC family transcriptional regulator [Microbacterium halotolerans]|uniref:AraC family transcriptional regulator n=1 Tax=Microbacterium halotolerans TaxID=246613 RepID=UPI000E6AE2AA|nr:AraC family transcriptional regulator [Microbacterium halotolerans]